MSEDPILVRPVEESDDAYVHSTARRTVADQLGRRYCHKDTVIRLVDALLDASLVRIAQLRDDPDILAWIAWGQGGEIEFLYLRETLFLDALRREGRSAPGSYRGRIVDLNADSLFVAPRIGLGVVRALIGETDAILRRPIDRRAIQALVLAGYEPSIIPRAI